MKKFRRAATMAFFAFAFVATLFSKDSTISRMSSASSTVTETCEFVYDDGNSRDGIYIL